MFQRKQIVSEVMDFIFSEEDLYFSEMRAGKLYDLVVDGGGSETFSCSLEAIYAAKP